FRSLYLNMSCRNPCPLVCLPRVQTPPSISIASISLGRAKSNLNLRSGSTRYSASISSSQNTRHKWSCISRSTSLIFGLWLTVLNSHPHDISPSQGFRLNFCPSRADYLIPLVLSHSFPFGPCDFFWDLARVT